MNALMETIIQGWADSIKDLPTDVRVFWSFRDELAVEDGIIFKGKQVLIPESLRADILAQLHQSHQGIEKTQLLAREGVYWPNINKDIEHMTRTCTLCQELANCNKKEPLIPHDAPMAPWKKLGTDLFEVDGEHFVLICDYFSKYSIVTPLHRPPQVRTSQRKSEKLCHCSADPTRSSVITDHSTSGNHSRTLSTSGAYNTPPHHPGSHSPMGL